MTQTTTSEIEASLKSIYGDKWKQALIMHIIIGAGQIIANRIKSKDPSCKRKAYDNEQPAEKTEPIMRIQQNPLEYVRSRSRRVGEILEDELHDIPWVAVGHEILKNSPEIGDLLQAIGAQALERLKESEMRKSRTLPKN